MRHGWSRIRKPEAGDDEPVDYEPHDLAALFATPPWLRDLGTSAWLAVGVTLLTIGAVWLMALTKTIVTPLIAAAVVAAVTAPVIRVLERRGVARGLGAALLLLGFVVLSALVVLMVLGGISSQSDELRDQLIAAKTVITGWLTDVGIDPAAAGGATDDVSTALTDAIPALLAGIGEGLRKLSSLVVFLGLTFLSAFFLLKDGPQIRHWAEGHMRVPRHVAHGVGQRVLQSLRGYFLGVTLVAAFNGTLVLVGALILGVPLAGSIAVVTFLAAYVPYFGAWTAGVFSILVALGGAGADAALGMLIVQLLANGVLQQLIQPIAYGATLGIHPLAVLLVTIAGGSLFGAVGLILAAPLTAAATRVAADLARARAAAAPPPEPQPESAAAGA